jgi:bacillopeptidase F
LGEAANGGVVDPGLQAVIQAQAPHEEVGVIITLADRVNPRQFKYRDKRLRQAAVAATLKARGEIAQRPVTEHLRNRGVRGLKDLWLINGIAATVRADQVDELARFPGVESVRLDRVLSLPPVGAGVAAPAEWNLLSVRAPELWALGYTGSGVVVANMDTGVDPDHPDLAGKWRGGTNSWFDPHQQHAAPFDPSGHGTQTMGVMLGGAAGGTAIGVAPDANWIAAKIFDDGGQALASDVHLAFQWLLDPDGQPATADAPDVVNASWSYGQTGACVTEFDSDIQTLKAAGIAVVVAAGNTGPAPATSESPANYPDALGVGAVDATHTVAGFSSRGPSACGGGPFPDLTAPGVDIRTADLSYGGWPFYTTVSGTSFAAPQVAGGMALLLSAEPTADVYAIEAALSQSAQDLGAAGPDNDYGQGLIDLVEAHALLAAAGGNTPPAITSLPPTAATAGSLYRYQVEAVDPDRGDVLTYSLDPGAPPGMAIDATTGLVTWVPSGEDLGTRPLTLRVTDSASPAASASQSFDILVGASPAVMFFSTAHNTAVPGVPGPYDRADVYAWASDGSFRRVFDASGPGAAGLPLRANVDAVVVAATDAAGAASDIYLSFSNDLGIWVPGIGMVQDEDVVRGQRDGSNWTWTLFFDGSDVGLGDVAGEDVDAFEILPDGSVLVSTAGRPSVPGLDRPVLRDEDLLRCAGGFGPATTCTWSLYFDGSDVGLGSAGRGGLSAASVSGNDLYLTTFGASPATGSSGRGNEVALCRDLRIGPATSCASWSLFYVGLHGLDSIDALDLP